LNISIDHKPSESKEANCPVCQHTNVATFVQINDQPVHIGLLWSNRRDALNAPRGDLNLTICNGCGHVFNRAFDPKLMEYDQPYDNSLFYSKVFHEYARHLANDLITRYDINNKNILEIGSGRGDFLKLMCELGNNHGTGYDPSYKPEGNGTLLSHKISFIKGMYTEKDALIQADLVCCRHTLEHLARPDELLHVLRSNFTHSPNTILYFEVPNFDYTLRKTLLWDLIYEHCHYFTAGSLRTLFVRCGFEIIRLYEAFGGQYLGLECRIAPRILDKETDGQVDFHKVFEFSQKANQRVQSWAKILSKDESKGIEVVAWGAGAKGVCFLNILNLQEKIHYIVDLNPRKHGMFIPGTGQKIVAPKALCSIKPGMVVVMNPLYENEIVESLTNLHIKTEIQLA